MESAELERTTVDIKAKAGARELELRATGTVVKFDGFLAVYPDGYEQHWNDCRAAAPYAANKKNIDDVGFFGAMVDFFVAEQHANADRVPFNPAVNGYFWIAAGQAALGGDEHLGPDHLLVALSTEDGTPAADLLKELGAGRAAVRTAVAEARARGDFTPKQQRG